MIDSIPMHWFHVLGLGTAILIGVYILTNFQEWIRMKWRKRNAMNGYSNRKDDGMQGWPAQMLVLLGGIVEKLDSANQTLDDMRNVFSKNGFAKKDDFEALRRIIEKCRYNER